jgi:arylsulfatase
VIDAQRRAAAFLQTFIDYPPSQIPASFTIDQIEEGVRRRVQELMQKSPSQQ